MPGAGDIYNSSMFVFNDDLSMIASESGSHACMACYLQSSFQDIHEVGSSIRRNQKPGRSLKIAPETSLQGMYLPSRAVRLVDNASICGQFSLALSTDLEDLRADPDLFSELKRSNTVSIAFSTVLLLCGLRMGARDEKFSVSSLVAAGGRVCLDDILALDSTLHGPLHLPVPVQRTIDALSERQAVESLGQSIDCITKVTSRFRRPDHPRQALRSPGLMIYGHLVVFDNLSSSRTTRTSSSEAVISNDSR
ncbi:hypothetical protein KCU95_g24, partial [Aureobasidium melanogenum]